jgi:putative acetyltransferase
VIVRRERTADVPASRAAHAAAFACPEGAPEPVEAVLLDALRACDGWLDHGSFVVEIDARIAAHAVCTLAHVDRVHGGTMDVDSAAVDAVPVWALGPIAVLPELQRAGAGSALVHTLIGAADVLGVPLIGLLGSPAYYARFGFVPATAVGIEPPDPAWGVHFQVRTLTTWQPTMRGRFRYAAPFDDLP